LLLVTSALSGWFNHGVNSRTASNNRSPIYYQNKHNEKHHRRTGSPEARPSLPLQSTGVQPRARLKTSLTILLRSLLPSSSFFFAILFCKIFHEFIQKQPKMKISKALGLFFPSKHASFLIFQRDQSTALQPTVSIFLLSL
jgi:fatty acid desaturase